jgi:hypothetical protein
MGEARQEKKSGFYRLLSKSNPQFFPQRGRGKREIFSVAAGALFYAGEKPF